jgi:hypothetical protein
MAGNLSRLAGESLGLFGEMLGNPPVEPALDLGGQVQNFVCHGEVLFRTLLPPVRPSRGTPLSFGVTINIGHLTDRFQYLSFNIM